MCLTPEARRLQALDHVVGVLRGGALHQPFHQPFRREASPVALPPSPAVPPVLAPVPSPAISSGGDSSSSIASDGSSGSSGSSANGSGVWSSGSGGGVSTVPSVAVGCDAGDAGSRHLSMPGLTSLEGAADAAAAHLAAALSPFVTGSLGGGFCEGVPFLDLGTDFEDLFGGDSGSGATASPVAALAACGGLQPAAVHAGAVEVSAVMEGAEALRGGSDSDGTCVPSAECCPRLL
jgi:hypothetical protein